MWPPSSAYVLFVISLGRCNTGGATRKADDITEGRLSPTESASGGFLRRVERSVGEPVHSSEHPTSALTHARTHRSPQQGIKTNPSSRNKESALTV